MLVISDGPPLLAASQALILLCRFDFAAGECLKLCSVTPATHNAHVPAQLNDAFERETGASQLWGTTMV